MRVRVREWVRARVRERDKDDGEGEGEDKDRDQRRARDRPDDAMPNCQPSGVAVGHHVIRGREEGMWEEDQREEDSGRREDNTSAHQSSEVCSTFHFQEWLVWLSQALVQIGPTAQSSLCSGSARLEPAREPSRAHFGHEPICWLSLAQNGSARLAQPF